MFIPDVMVASSESLSVPGSLYVEPKDVILVAETISPGNGGIPFYLELELPGTPRVTVYELRGAEYVRVADARAGETLRLTEPFAVSFDPGDLVGPRTLSG
jgi:hypothetical protein